MPRDGNPSSRYGIICPAHERQGLTTEQYHAQMSRPDDLWKCPIGGCQERVQWDDLRYENPPPKGEWSSAPESTDSNPNISPTPRKNDKVYFTPAFEDPHGNKLCFLYQDFVKPTKEEATHRAMQEFLSIVSMGLHFVEALEIPENAFLPHVECVIEHPLFGTKYKVALISGPEFEKHYTLERAEQVDADEHRAEHAKKQAEELDRQHYEHEVKVVNDALDQPDQRLH